MVEGHFRSHRGAGGYNDDRFSADNLTSMVEKVTSGATGALGRSLCLDMMPQIYRG